MRKLGLFVFIMLISACQSKQVIVPAVVHNVSTTQEVVVEKARLPIIGEVEPIYFLPMKSPFAARIDTGATTSSLDCNDVEYFERDGEKWVSFKLKNRKTGEEFELTPAVIRGIESQGMLCSQDELGLDGMQEEDGILILSRLYENIELGTKLEELLNIKEDTILDVAPTANRGDEMSVIGVAREICSLFNKKLNFSKIESTKDLYTNKFKVEILAEDACKYYAAGILKDVVIKPSPTWMKRRLEVSGIRSINNVVDITNYVLLEYGQPLHAFDMDKLDGYICVRRAKEGETIVTLDGVKRKLNTDSILCATKEKGVCVAGVFGAENSEVDENTKNIVLESAYFTAPTNRKSSRSIGYRSEACARFERGVDIESTRPALLRAMQLLTEYADAKVEGVAETGKNKLDDVFKISIKVYC